MLSGNAFFFFIPPNCVQQTQHLEINLSSQTISEEQSCTCLVNFASSSLVPAVDIRASLTYDSTTFDILQLQTLPDNLNTFHGCLIRSQPFAGTGRFLAGLFAFLSRWPTVKRLGASGRNRFITIITMTRKMFSVLSFMT